MFSIALYILILFISSAIIYQDFKKRRISVVLIILFAGFAFWKYISLVSFTQLLQNSLFCLLYLFLCFFILKLYFIIKSKTKLKIIDVMIGWGDIVLLFIVGCFIEPEYLVFFFTSVFVLSLIIVLLFQSKKNTIPLAGYLLIAYNLYLLLSLFE